MSEEETWRWRLEEYLERLAARQPTPGGGSAAALAGALGAALVSMVANFTIGNPRFASVQEEVAGLLGRSEEARRRLARLSHADTQAYGQVAAAGSLPRGTEQEMEARRVAIQEALKEAVGVPLEVTRLCAGLLDICARMAGVGNPALVSDVGVAACLAEAALQSAALNVEVNLASIKDEAFNSQVRSCLQPMVEEAPGRRKEVWARVVKKISRL